MSSSDDTTRTPTTVRALACLVAGVRDAARAVSDVLAAEPALLAEVPDETLEALTLELHDAVDAATASATVVTGRLEREVGGVRGKLIAGRYASTARFLECEGHLSPATARATVARGRDLHTHSTRVADAWLAGDIPGGAVQALTLGVSDVLRRSARADRPVARDEALDRLLPVAKERDVRRLGREVATLLMHVDPDGTTEDALFAFENQSLSIVCAGTMFKLSGWLTPETAVAAKTTLEAVSRQIATEQVGEVVHDPDCDAVLEAGSSCTCGEVDRARRAAGLRHDVLMARAFDEVMRDRLDGASLGSHHGVAPVSYTHLTLPTKRIV